MAGKASKLVKDLQNIPEIISGLGLGVATAQRAFNLDYLESLERLVAIAKMMGTPPASPPASPPDPPSPPEAMTAGVFLEILKTLAPARYQFTETTLAVRLDLAQTMDVGANVGLGGGVGALTVNASLAMSYGYDYQAAAEVRTVLHAHAMDPQVLKTLLTRAGTVNDDALTVPPRSEVDTEIIKQSERIYEKMHGTAPTQKVEEKEEEKSE